MTNIYNAPNQTRIKELLEQDGPMTAVQIAEILGMKRYQVETSIKGGYERTSGKIFYVADYKRSFGTKGMWGRVWAVGSEPDKEKPKGNLHKQANIRYREKNKAVLRMRRRAKKHGTKSINHWFQILGVTQRETEKETCE